MECEVCGQESQDAFQVTRHAGNHYFDTFECAIHACAPTCAHCGCKIIGHGVQAGETIYCCAHCARQAGTQGLSDRT